MLDHFIDGQWARGHGEPFSSTNPATAKEVLQTRNAISSEVTAAFAAAGTVFEEWAGRIPEARFQVARQFATIVQARRQEFVTAISSETGKPLWESNQEVDTVIKKIDLSISAYQVRTGYHEQQTGSVRSSYTHSPHGIVAILGPFNFPAHLPNGHIVPALIAGNSAVFKPSELTPLTGALMADCWQEAGLPAGCLNLLQGGRQTAELILQQPGIAGVFFTGSAATGAAIHQRFAGHPEVILALEMGGNNPLVVLDKGNGSDELLVRAAARTIAVSAFISAGQRCTCTRRLIVVADDILPELIRVTETIRVGAPDAQPEPFIGPVISAPAAQKILETQKQLISKGARVLVECQPTKDGIPFLKPGLLDVTAVPNRPDEEIFGPLLQVIRVNDFEAAIAEANRTRFGLAAGLVGGTEQQFETFRRRVRAGIINWNRPTTGASSAAPFGGIDLSGNHRPSAFYAADYCAYPIATMQSTELNTPQFPGLG